jgi:hypothetical protein
MPNWVYNSLSIEGEPALIAEVKQQLNKPFAQKHDSWNMQTREMEVKDFTYNNPIFAFHNIYNHTQDGVSDEDYIKQPEHKSGQSFEDMFSGNDWYSWNVRNWGTKWDVAVHDNKEYSDTELMDETEGSIAYRFNTAWSPPNSAISKLSTQYPSLVFTLSYEEETGWGGEIVFEDGEGNETEIYGWKCRECDHIEEDTPYCEECEFDTCPSCGYNEADEACEQHREGHNAHLLT